MCAWWQRECGLKAGVQARVTSEVCLQESETANAAAPSWAFAAREQSVEKPEYTTHPAYAAKGAVVDPRVGRIKGRAEVRMEREYEREPQYECPQYEYWIMNADRSHSLYHH